MPSRIQTPKQLNNSPSSIDHLRRLYQLLRDMGCITVRLVYDPNDPDINPVCQIELQVLFHDGIHRFFVDDYEWFDPSLADRIAMDVLRMSGKADNAEPAADGVEGPC